MVKTLSKNITYYIGAFAMFFVGLFYMFMSDLTFKNPSSMLIVSVLLSFSSAILFFLSASFSEKPKIMFLFKGLAVALAIGFTIYIHFFQVSEYYLNMLERFRRAGISGESDLAASQATMIVTLILGYISFLAQGANTVLVAVMKEN